MLKTPQTVSMVIFGLVVAVVSPARAALETHDGSMPDRVVVAVTDSQQLPGAACIPPEPQYFSTFIRDIDGIIIGIRYDIVDYVC